MPRCRPHSARKAVGGEEVLILPAFCNGSGSLIGADEESLSSVAGTSSLVRSPQLTSLSTCTETIPGFNPRQRQMSFAVAFSGLLATNSRISSAIGGIPVSRQSGVKRAVICLYEPVGVAEHFRGAEIHFGHDDLRLYSKIRTSIIVNSICEYYSGWRVNNL